jgi:eukaryotic-like serine/threonine-protein kinase
VASRGANSTNLVKFGDDFEFDLRSFELRRSGQPLKLERIPMELLLLLIEQRGQLVSRDQIVERVWGKDVFLDTDNSINAAIRKIRLVLKDDPEQPRFVQTITGRGYRFIAQVEQSVPPAVSLPAAETPATPSDGLLGKRVAHYRILQMLGGGGMGVVYMAEDLKLGRRVALKFLPAEVGSDPKAFERFEQEARAASSLDHPNICSIYQLGEHEGRPFIVMQLLEGRTLREWIENSGVPNTQSRLGVLLDLAGQIADGLEAAHKKGIIHRDIKPANIFVTSGGQAKILDFGVAKIAEGFESSIARTDEPAISTPVMGVADASVTRSEGSVGTPSYLSPEQIRREKLDARSDLFSFGLVLYEMATGQRAFAGNTATAIRDAVLRVPALPLRQVNPAIPLELEKIIQKSLEKDRDKRYQSASDLRSDLRRMAGTVPPRASHRRPGLLIAVAALVIAILLFATNVGGFRKRLFGSQDTGGSVAQVKARTSVAVLGFKNLSGKDDEAWISTALAEMLSTELSAGQQVRVIPSENVARMKLDLSLPPSDSYARDTLEKIRNQLNSDMVVMGSYLALGKEAGGKVRIDLQLQDARAGETIASMSTDGAESDLAALISRSGATLRQRLGIGDVTAQDQRQISSSVPNGPEAARLYAEGLIRLQTFDALGARDLLQKAVLIDPNHALSHSALAQCWSILGYDAKARDEAKKAVDLSSNLLREDQLSIEGRYRETNHESKKAVEIYRMLWGVFPDNLEYGLRLAKAQASAGSGKDSMVTIEALTKLPPPGGTDPRIDLAETLAADQLGDLHREEAAAARAAEKGRRQGAKIITASALLTRGSVLSALGDEKNAIAALEEARDFFFAVGDQQSAARALINLAIIKRHQSSLDEAQKLLESALEISRKTGNTLALVKCINNLGAVLNAKGDIKGAIQAFQEGLRLSREIGAKVSESTALNNLAACFTMQGDLKEGRQTFEQTLQLSRDMGDEEGAAIALVNLADVLTRQGELRAARKTGEEALVAHQKIGDKSFEGYALHQLGLILTSQGDLAGGRARYQQAEALRHELGEKVTEAETQLLVAQLELDTGDAAAAESAARKTATAFHDGGSSDDEALSYSLLSLALAEEKNLPGALDAGAKAKELLAKSQEMGTRIQVEINDAYVNALAHGASATKGANDASDGLPLQAAREKADHTGYVGLSLDARLRLGEVELNSGLTRGGRTHLEQLQKDAQARGFVLIARKAVAAMKFQSARR